jgi:hypothetical protein
MEFLTLFFEGFQAFGEQARVGWVESLKEQTRFKPFQLNPSAGDRLVVFPEHSFEAAVGGVVALELFHGPVLVHRCRPAH